MSKQESRLPIFTKRLGEVCAENVSAFAKKAGITRQALNSYRNENRLPDCEILKKICVAADVSADYLIGLSETKKPDATIRAVCKSTGLSEKAVMNIRAIPSDLLPILDHLLTADFPSMILMLQNVALANRAANHPHTQNDDPLLELAYTTPHHNDVTGDITLPPSIAAEFLLSQSAEYFKKICRKDGES